MFTRSTPEDTTRYSRAKLSGTPQQNKNIATIIRNEILMIPLPDSQEQKEIDSVVKWIDSGADIFRQASPATPPKHLTACFVLVHEDEILLVDHIQRGHWLPAGAHVEPSEHPRATVEREVEDEFGLAASFVYPFPVMLTRYDYPPREGRHSDIALWYLLHANREQTQDWDRSEFYKAKWFKISALPLQQCDPNMGRFARKINQLKAHN